MSSFRAAAYRTIQPLISMNVRFFFKKRFQSALLWPTMCLEENTVRNRRLIIK